MPSKRQAATWGVVIVAAAALCWVFPPFHMVPLDAARSGNRTSTGPSPLSARETADKLWEQQLPAAAHAAPDAAVVLGELLRDPAAARKKYGRTVGIGGSTYCLISGRARVVRREGRTIELRLLPAQGSAPESGTADLLIDMSPLFGNALRDGSGLFDVNQYASFSDSGAISSELNRRVEDRVFPILRDKAAVGAEIRFGGVAEVDSDQKDPRPLHLVPVFVEAG